MSQLLGGVCCFTLVGACVRPINYRENRRDYFTEIWCKDTYGQYAIFAIRPFFWPSSGNLENQTFAILELTVVGKDSPIFMVGVSDEASLHITQAFDLTYFSRSQRSKFVKNYEVVIISSTMFSLCVNMYTISPTPYSAPSNNSEARVLRGIMPRNHCTSSLSQIHLMCLSYLTQIHLMCLSHLTQIHFMLSHLLRSI
jgi:hypothetical protein